jgi:hypothetical protein
MLFPGQAENGWAEAFVCLVRRLLIEGVEASVEHGVGHDWDFNRTEYHTCDCDVFGDEFVQLVRSIAPARNEWLDVEFPYPLANGGEASISARFCGVELDKENDDPYLPWQNQQIMFRLYRHDRGGPWKEGAPKTLTRLLRRHACGRTSHLETNAVFRDVVEILLRALGIAQEPVVKRLRMAPDPRHD